MISWRGRTAARPSSRTPPLATYPKMRERSATRLSHGGAGPEDIGHLISQLLPRISLPFDLTSPLVRILTVWSGPTCIVRQSLHVGPLGHRRSISESRISSDHRSPIVIMC